jgi:poly-gamma-glutamate capsule biosynthesis protein CapA/YwtB (metallophosphatase superfamily)
MHSDGRPETGNSDNIGETTLFLCGDVMAGRGIDQILPRPCDPEIFEQYMKSALGYVALAEKVNGPIPIPVDFDYVWGDSLAELERRPPDLRLINLETAVTTSGDPAPKGINYRMNPENAPLLSVAGIDCCVLANNHVLDWGEPGLLETLQTLRNIHVSSTGAGVTLDEAISPALLPVPGGRVAVFAFGSPSAGVPGTWAADDERPGVNFLPRLDADTLRTVAGQVNGSTHTGDLVVASIHWGGNWGYEIPGEQREFARGLIDEAGVDIVWGHSSHHPKAIEVYRGRLILFGCGDFLNDYEGIRGHERYRSDLVLMYLPMLNLADGGLHGLRLVPFRIRRFRLQRASKEESRWLGRMLNREGERQGTRLEVEADNTLALVI